MASANTLGPTVAAITATSAAVQVATTTTSYFVQIGFDLQNISTSTVYIGGSAVSSTNGIVLTAGSTKTFDNHMKRDERKDYGLDNYWVMTTTLGTAATTTVIMMAHNVITRR